MTWATSLCGVFFLGSSICPAEARPNAPTAQSTSIQTVQLEAIVAGSAADRGSSLWRKLIGQQAEDLLVRPFGIIWEGDDLLVTDPGAGRVVRISLRGKLLQVSSSELAGPMGVAVCMGRIVITESTTGRVLLLDPSLRPKSEWATDLERPTGLACYGNRLIVAETGRHRLIEFDIDTEGNPPTRLRTIGRRGTGSGEFNFPTTVTADSEGIWIGDTLNFRLQRLDTESLAQQTEFGRLGDTPGAMPRLKGVGVDVWGRIWVSDAYLDQISLYDRSGQFLSTFGGTGSEPGEFSFPAGIATHLDGRVAIVDSLNQRIQVFRSLAAGAPAAGTKGRK